MPPRRVEIAQGKRVAAETSNRPKRKATRTHHQEPTVEVNDPMEDEEVQLGPLEDGRRLQLVTDDQRNKYYLLRGKPYNAWRYVEFPLLNAYGCREQVEAFMNQPGWRELFSWRDDTYSPIVKEVVATLEVDKSVRRLEMKSIKFQLFGEQMHLSSNDLGRILGFYSEEEMMTPEFRDLLGDFAGGSTEAANFWRRIGRRGVNWNSSNTKQLEITNHAVRTVRGVLAYMWGKGGDNFNKLTQYFLFCLWSMVDSEPVHMGAVCRHILYSQAKDEARSVFIGPLVSRICIGLGFGQNLAREVRRDRMVPLKAYDMETRMGIPRIPVQDENDEQAPQPFQYVDLPPHYPPVTDWASVQRFNHQLYHDAEQAADRRLGEVKHAIHEATEEWKLALNESDLFHHNDWATSERNRHADWELGEKNRHDDWLAGEEARRKEMQDLQAMLAQMWGQQPPPPPPQ